MAITIFIANFQLFQKSNSAMPQIHGLSQRRSEDLLTPFMAALLIVLFLFFIDEGYYDFRWMKEWGNWFVFGIYLVIFFPIQWLISHFVFRKLNGWRKILAMVALGIPATVLFFWLLF
jgi:hypothetical protein